MGNARLQGQEGLPMKKFKGEIDLGTLNGDIVIKRRQRFVDYLFFVDIRTRKR